MLCFDTLHDALAHLQARNLGLEGAKNGTEKTAEPPAADGRKNTEPLVFLHPGTYAEASVLINFPAVVIGAGPGTAKELAASVLLEGRTETTVKIREGAGRAYLGYLSVRFAPESTNAAPHHSHYAVEVAEEEVPPHRPLLEGREDGQGEHRRSISTHFPTLHWLEWAA